MRYFLRKNNRLHHEKKISLLFKKGKSVFVYPVKLTFLPVPKTSLEESNFQVMFIVSKRNFKKAVQRNLIRRRIKEAFRLNYYKILPAIPEDMVLFLAFSFVAKEEFEYNILEGAVNELLVRMTEKLSNESVKSFN